MDLSSNSLRTLTGDSPEVFVPVQRFFLITVYAPLLSAVPRDIELNRTPLGELQRTYGVNTLSGTHTSITRVQITSVQFMRCRQASTLYNETRTQY